MPKPLVELNEIQKKELWDSFNLLDPEGTGDSCATKNPPQLENCGTHKFTLPWTSGIALSEEMASPKGFADPVAAPPAWAR
jgi:hypothetical protein